jgi:viroplasmin and RNaseH domain-containing protein
MSLQENYISVIYQGDKIGIYKPWAEKNNIKEGYILGFNEYKAYNSYVSKVFNL